MEVLNSAPQDSDFISLSTHQSETPESFYNGPPVLHHCSRRCTLKVSEHELGLAPAFAGLAAGGQMINGSGHVNGDTTAKTLETGAEHRNGNIEGLPDSEIEIRGIDVWVTSEYVWLQPASNPACEAQCYPGSINLTITQTLHTLLSDPNHRRIHPIPQHLSARSATTLVTLSTDPALDFGHRSRLRRW